MQYYVSALCYAAIPGLQEERQSEMMVLVQAKADLKALEESDEEGKEAKEDELVNLIDARWSSRKRRMEGTDRSRLLS